MIHSISELSGDMVQTQVHLIQRQHLLGRLGVRILVHLGILLIPWMAGNALEMTHIFYKKKVINLEQF